MQVYEFAHGDESANESASARVFVCHGVGVFHPRNALGAHAAPEARKHEYLCVPQETVKESVNVTGTTLTDMMTPLRRQNGSPPTCACLTGHSVQVRQHSRDRPRAKRRMTHEQITQHKRA